MYEFDVTYSECALIIETWQTIKSNKKFEHELGSEIFRKFIELEPAAKDPLGVDLDDIEKNSERFQKVTKKYFEKLDLVIDMLGPDLEVLRQDLEDLGRRHGTFGVKSSFFYPLGEATIRGLKLIAPRDITDEAIDAWKHLYGFLEDNMVRGCNSHWSSLSEPTTW